MKCECDRRHPAREHPRRAGSRYTQAGWASSTGHLLEATSGRVNYRGDGGNLRPMGGCYTLRGTLLLVLQFIRKFRAQAAQPKKVNVRASRFTIDSLEHTRTVTRGSHVTPSEECEVFTSFPLLRSENDSHPCQAGSTEDRRHAGRGLPRWAASYCSIVSYCIPWALLAWHAASSGCWLVDAGRSSERKVQVNLDLVSP